MRAELTLKKAQEISLEELKQIILEEMIYLRDVCEKNNIKYFLYGGSLLGAVKYKGFIPWDDDIDIALFREDYEKLVNILEKENGKYEILTIYNTKDYYYLYAKFVNTKTKIIDNGRKIEKLGAFVDIFPIDGVPDNYQKHMNKMRILKNLSSRRMRLKNNIKKSNLKEKQEKVVKYRKVKDFIYATVDYLTMPLGNNFWAKMLDKKVRKYKIENYNYVSRYRGDIFEKSLFEETSIYEFENEKFTSVKNADAFLKQIYGDYMEELPKEQQKSHHQLKVMWREKNG